MKKFFNLLVTILCTVILIITGIIATTYIEGKYLNKSFLVLVDTDKGVKYVTSDMFVDYNTHCVKLLDNDSVELCNFYIEKIVFSN